MAKILIVDDERDIRQLIRIQLERMGHTVLDAADGREAINKASDEKPDLILMDIMMPGITGLQAASVLKKLDDTKDIKIVAISNKYEGSPKACLEAGCAFYALKPTTLSEVKQVITKAGLPVK